MNKSGQRLILLTGATGYVGGRLLKALELRGDRLRCLARKPEVLRERVSESTEVVGGDALDPDALREAMHGIDTAFYLIHSLGSGSDFEDIEENAARNFAEAAREAGLRRIIYLGGLFDEDRVALSPHMRSRCRVGEVLRESGVPVIEFRASIIIGSGSLSFELIRSLVRRLPVMVTPRWVSVMAQPVAIRDVMAWLIAALDSDLTENRIYEIGGADRMSYEGLMREYARQCGRRFLLIRVPVLTPRLSSLWLHLVTPVYARIGRKLIESMRIASIVRDDAAFHDFNIQPLGVSAAIEAAIREEKKKAVESCWADAFSASAFGQKSGTIHAGRRRRVTDVREAHVHLDAEKAFAPIQQIGGHTGWYYGTFLWKIRGLIDRLFGGVGTGRGRRDPVDLRTGDVIDWWRVEKFEPPFRLLLKAEMKVPGDAWLQFEVTPHDEGCHVSQTAIFYPAGISGLLYWYVLYPVHWFIFKGMLRNIIRQAAS